MSEDRYIRQRILTEIGDDGQQRLEAAAVAVVGCGALGTHQAQLLARAGVGRLRVIDRDVVEISNLQRQVLFTDDDARDGIPKAVAARSALEAANPDITVEAIVEDLHPGNADELLSEATLICDGTDNLETRYLVNDFAIREGIPWVYGGVVSTGGLVHPIVPGETACLRCVFEIPPPAGALPTCDTAGVLGSAAAVIGAVQATEAIKIVVGATDRRIPGLLRYDAWSGTYDVVETGAPRADCPACGLRRFEFLEGRRAAAAARFCGRNAVQILPGENAAPPRLSSVAARLGPEWEVTVNEHLLRARRGDVTLNLFASGRMIADGVDSESEARSLHARVVGA